MRIENFNYPDPPSTIRRKKKLIRDSRVRIGKGSRISIDPTQFRVLQKTAVVIYSPGMRL